MEPHNPARRHLLAGLLVGLFGWILPRKAQATPPQPQPASDGPGYTRQERFVSTYSCASYDSVGELIARSEPLSREGVNTYHYDCNHRLLSITQSFPPCS